MPRLSTLRIPLDSLEMKALNPSPSRVISTSFVVEPNKMLLTERDAKKEDIIARCTGAYSVRIKAISTQLVRRIAEPHKMEV